MINPAYNAVLSEANPHVFWKGSLVRVVKNASPLAITKPIIVMDDQTLHVTGAATLRAQDYHNALVEFFREYARKDFTPHMRKHCHAMGATFERLRVSHARSRWGSCSSSGTISLNWQLIRLPQEIIDYVMIHEIAHTFHMNHSRDFWGVVADFCHDYRYRREFLKHISLRWGYSFWRF